MRSVFEDQVWPLCSCERSTCCIIPPVTVNSNTPAWEEDELTFGWGERPIQMSGQADIYHTRATLEMLPLKNRVKEILDFCVTWVNTNIKRKSLTLWEIRPFLAESRMRRLSFSSIFTAVNRSCHFKAMKPDCFLIVGRVRQVSLHILSDILKLLTQILQGSFPGQKFYMNNKINILTGCG